MSAWSRVRNVFRRDLNDDIDAELSSHLVEAHAAGRDPLEIQRSFGSRLRARETTRDAVIAVWLESWLLDLRHAVRQLWRSPVFAAAAVLTVALGVGATTAVFTIIEQVIFRKLPVANADRLWRLGEGVRCCYSTGYSQRTGTVPNSWSLFSWDAYRHFRANTAAFEELAAFQIGTGNGELAVRPADAPAPVQERLGQYVSGNFFRTFGLTAWRGRLFSDTDDADAAPFVAVMSFHTWQDGYGSDPAVVGRTYEINGHPCTVVGIAPPGFFGAKVDAGTMPDLWLPLSHEPLIAGPTSRLKNPRVAWLDVIGRVRPGTNSAGLEAQLRVELRQWLDSHLADMSPQERSVVEKQTLRLTPGGAGVSMMREEFQDALWLLLLAALCVLLLACANVANLMLARGWRNAHQTAMRTAIGATPARLVRSALIESAVLGLAGGAAGIAMAYAGARLILALAFRDSWVPVSAAPASPMLLFALVVSLLTGLVFGIAPAWISARTGPIDAVRATSRTARRSTAARWILVVAQASASMILLSVAVMLGQSLRNLQRQPLGFTPEGRYLVSIDTRLSGYHEDQVLPLIRGIEAGLRAIPRVNAVSVMLYAPLGGLYWSHDVRFAGRPEPNAGDNLTSAWTRVTPGFFDTIDDRIVIGRPITDADDAQTRRVAVVNQAFARKFFPNENPIGRHFGPATITNADAYEIVGVAADIQYFPSEAARPLYFVPQAQGATFEQPELQGREVWSHYPYNIVIWAPGDPRNIGTEVRNTLATIAPDLVVQRIESYSDVVRRQYAPQNMIASLSWIFGAIGLVLATVGLYGLTEYRVEQQTTEIGVRIALGGNRRSIVIMVLRGAFTPVGVGIALGVPAAIGAGWLMANQLFGVTAWDPKVLFAAAIVLTTATLIGAAVPALRAASVNPLRALRSE